MMHKKTIFPDKISSLHQLFGSRKDRCSHLQKVQNKKFSVISKHDIKCYTKYHLIVVLRTKVLSFSFLKTSWMSRKTLRNDHLSINFVFWQRSPFFREIHNINFSVVFNMHFRFVQNCFCNNISFFHGNLFILSILKDLVNLLYKRKTATE